MRLSRFQKLLVTSALNDLFGRFEAGFLGRFFSGPSIYFMASQEVDPLDTLEGAYIYTLKQLFGPRAAIDEKEMKDLSEITHNYIEAERLRRTNHLMADIKAATSTAELHEAVQENMDKATNYISMLTVTESSNVIAYAERDGITKIAASIGDEDPTVVKLGIVDEKLCPSCKELWHDSASLAKPRPWKGSELRDGYNKSQKNPVGTWSATHPHCRHRTSYCPKGYGFDDSGMIKFIAFGYDYYEDYYKTHKHEQIDENLAKSCTCGHFSELLET